MYLVVPYLVIATEMRPEFTRVYYYLSHLYSLDVIFTLYFKEPIVIAVREKISSRIHWIGKKIVCVGRTRQAMEGDLVYDIVVVPVVQIIFLRSSRIRVDLLSYVSKPLMGVDCHAEDPGLNAGRRKHKRRICANFRTFYYWKIFSLRN